MSKLKRILFVVIVAVTFICAVGCTSTLSAYDVAVKNGFEGTEEQWLLSLKGKDGTDGADLKIKDIYDEAVINGFDGSYMDFLNEFLSYEEAPDNSAAVTKGMRSAVLVYCRFSRNSSDFLSGREYAQAGVGVIYSINRENSSAYILTNYHVVYGSDSNSNNNVSSTITITPYGGTEIPVTYVGGSATYDIAVLKAENEYFASDFPLAVTLADSNDIVVGQTAIAIGNPAGDGLSATQGIISVDSEYIVMNNIENSSSYVQMRVIRIDAAVNSGNSGGGLFNSQGELIGIVNAKSSDDTIENMAYAIPSSIATAVADNIIKNIVFRKGTVGITVAIRDAKGYIDENGNIKIAETVVVDSAEGAASGKLFAGDIILSINLNKEIKVTRQFHVIEALLNSSPGDTVTFVVLRDGKEVEVEVVCS